MKIKGRTESVLSAIISQTQVDITHTDAMRKNKQIVYLLINNLYISTYIYVILILTEKLESYQNQIAACYVIMEKVSIMHLYRAERKKFCDAVFFTIKCWAMSQLLGNWAE